MGNAAPRFIVPTTGYTATFAPPSVNLALVDLPSAGSGMDPVGDSAEAPTPTSTPVSTPADTPSPTPTTTISSCVQSFPFIPPDDLASEQVIVDGINAHRLDHGLPPLTLAPELTQAGRLHSRDMADHNLPSHTGSDGSSPARRIAIACYQSTAWGEIIAWGFNDTSEALDWWMNSPVHRAEILNPGFRDLGVGYSYGPMSDLKRYWAVNFGGPGFPNSP